MILPGVFAAFLLGLVLEAVVIVILDRRANRREAAFWEELRVQALDGYGKVFDWADCAELGCGDDAYREHLERKHTDPWASL